MRHLLSDAERKFIQDLLNNDIEGYSYHYKKVLKRRIFDKRKLLTEDIALVTKAEDLLKDL